MKLIKKIVAIMFAFMMVVSMSCNVKANDTTAETGEGKITINNAILGQTYKIYKILELESYNPTTENYAYKVTAEWKSFIEDEGKDYLKKVDGTDYVNWVGDSSNNGEHVKTFAEKAIAYAKDVNNNINPLQTNENVTSNTVTFNNLPLGYYLVDSSVGTLCSLDTTKPAATIQEKNGVPSVDKIITSGGVVFNGGKSNSANIGDTVYFKTTITAQPGAQNYVLHDKMTEGLTFDQNSVNVSLHKNAQNTDRDLSKTTDYSVETTNLESTDPKCTFHVNFVPTFCDSLEANDIITVTYSATLNENAVIGNVDKNTNETWLKYGDSQSTQPKTTTTKTFEMNVFKYTENKTDKTKKDGLPGAVFTLSKKSDGTEPIKLIDKSSNVYRVAKTGDTGTVTEITTPNDGKFKIQGLGAGTYYLTETKQPAGYNKLKNPVTVVIDNDGNVKVDDANADPVEVENKTGTVLPSTGGAGTTMIYLIGGALVLGSGVVLATKRRVKGK